MTKTYKKYNLQIPFYVVDGTSDYLPFKVSDDASIFVLQARTKLALNPGAYAVYNTGIRMDVPEIVETVVDADKNESRYSKLVMHTTISTSPYLATTKGVVVLSPSVIPASQKSEIILVIQNISKEVQMIHPGDEMAFLAFTMVPRVSLNFVPPEPKGNTGYEF